MNTWNVSSLFFKLINSQASLNYEKNSPAEVYSTVSTYFVFVIKKSLKILITSQPGPGSAREKFDELMSPIWTFYVAQNFLSHDPFGF